jgi:hypothetical protein
MVSRVRAVGAADPVDSAADDAVLPTGGDCIVAAVAGGVQGAGDRVGRYTSSAHSPRTMRSPDQRPGRRSRPGSAKGAAQGFGLAVAGQDRGLGGEPCRGLAREASRMTSPPIRL